MGKQKFIFHWAGVDGPCAKFFDSLESLLAFLGSYEADVSVIGLVSTAATMAVDDATADATRLS